MSSKREADLKLDSDYKIKQLEKELSETRDDLRRTKQSLRTTSNDYRYPSDNETSYIDTQKFKSSVQQIDNFRKINLNSNFSNYDSTEFVNENRQEKPNSRIDSAMSNDYLAESKSKINSSYVTDDDRRLGSSRYDRGKNVIKFRQPVQTPR